MVTLPGIGELTAIVILAEINGFELIRNKKQLTSYAGLDVKEKQSGTSIKAKPRISKKDNRPIRKAMHFPSLVAVKWNENHRELYIRLVAIQRKLLEMCFVLFKSKRNYDITYKNSVQTQVV